MKYARFRIAEEQPIKLGIVEGEWLYEVEGELFSSQKKIIKENKYPLNSVKLEAPLMPRHIIGVGKNYVGPGEAKPPKYPDVPIFFFKPVSAVIGQGEDIVIPAALQAVKFEAELAVIIGKTASKIKETEAKDYIFGYTVANDVTAPQLFHPEGHWMVGKSQDTFSPLGPYIETDPDLSAVRVGAVHNGIEKQNSGLDLMILPIEYMISYLSHSMTLEPGDVILSGSPAGAEFMKDGDEIECSVTGIGVLRNRVVQSKN